MSAHTLGIEAAALLSEIKSELVKQSSPWLNRQSAAAYAHCSERCIDELADRGLLKRYWLGVLPRFKKADLDAVIESGAMPAVRRGRKEQ